MNFDPKKVKDWKQFRFKRDWVRLFYKPCPGGHGFKFVVLEVVSMSQTDSDKSCNRDPFSDSEEGVEIEIVIHGMAMFDGVRHLYYGHDESENYGYHYYPDVMEMVEILTAIASLEKTYCNYPSHER